MDSMPFRRMHLRYLVISVSFESISKLLKSVGYWTVNQHHTLFCRSLDGQSDEQLGKVGLVRSVHTLTGWDVGDSETSRPSRKTV